MLFVRFFAAISMALAYTIQNYDSIKTQLNVRSHSSSVIDSIYQALDLEETKFIDYNLQNLSHFEGNRCETCHNKIKHAKYLLFSNPDKQHLISLTLYKYCLEQNSGKDSKCEFMDFFVFTSHQNNFGHPGTESTHTKEATSINFFYNDFTEMVRHFNLSSELSLDYYCHYKGNYCDLPETPEISTIIDLDSMWPAKQPKHNSEPAYNQASETFNVLHLSDFHNQLRFEVGAEANCSQGLCCLPESFNKELTPDEYNFTANYKAAGADISSIDLSFYPEAHFIGGGTYEKGQFYDIPIYRGWNSVWEPATTFGNYKCDPPEVMLNHSLKFISSTFSQNDYEFAIFTGDIVDHDVAHCDANTTKYAETRSYRIMKHFLNKLPIYPTLGNHDTFPYGQLAPNKLMINTSDISLHWNDELISELWVDNGWIESSLKDFIRRHYSSYATVTKGGLKVISLNSNCYYQKNLYSYINMEADPDLFGQWSFLINELVESEKIGQRVWIIAHIPAGDYDTLPIQSSIFAKIVERFSPFTIANIFYGHTHRDQFKLLYKNETAISMAWISQAITPLGPANPSWRYYEVQEESFNILNSFNYYSRLNETWVNGAREPSWNYEYDTRATYDPEAKWPARAPLNATFWDEFVVKRLKNVSEITTNQRYADLMFRENPYVPNCTNGTKVTTQCYQNNYCDVIGFTVDDYNSCVRGLEHQYH
ncbi:hypothetical protein FT663_04655 [Candidozyma haemuli var. vulneris]|nr:hypothetical protein FT662_04798 [[Candida] haemuloni var. vulneris]KAF3986966.1 hypothetical protein FT663_04655 [[Candida] haemuloni var. vulneris]